MNKYFDQFEMMERLSNIEKAIYILSVVVENPTVITHVSLSDPFVKKDVFDEREKTLNLTVKFVDDGSIKTALVNHIEEVEKNISSQLEQVKKEKAKYG